MHHSASMSYLFQQWLSLEQARSQYIKHWWCTSFVLRYIIGIQCNIYPWYIEKLNGKKKMVKVQFRGPKLYKKKGALFQEESYLLRIFRSSSLNLHTFHIVNIAFWWQIFFHKYGNLTPENWQDHHVLVVEVMIMTSQCRCTRALSQSHVAKHDNHVPVMLLIGSGLDVMSMQCLLYGKIISQKY